MKLVHSDAKPQKKLKIRPNTKSIQNRKIAHLYEELSILINDVERVWQAADHLQMVLKKHYPESCASSDSLSEEIF